MEGRVFQIFLWKKIKFVTNNVKTRDITQHNMEKIEGMKENTMISFFRTTSSERISCVVAMVNNDVKLGGKAESFSWTSWLSVASMGFELWLNIVSAFDPIGLQSSVGLHKQVKISDHLLTFFAIISKKCYWRFVTELLHISSSYL